MILDINLTSASFTHIIEHLAETSKIILSTTGENRFSVELWAQMAALVCGKSVNDHVTVVKLSVYVCKLSKKNISLFK